MTAALFARASEADLGLLFLLLVIVIVAIAVYFLWVQNYIGAVFAVFIAILVAIFLL
jgi:hypothetical protein